MYHKFSSLFYTSLSLFLLFLAPLTTNATDPTDHSGFSIMDTEDAVYGLVNESIFDTITRFLNWTLGLIGILSVIGFVISGIFYLTSAGDEDQAKRAKTIMIYTITGLSVALVSLIIVNAIAGLTGAGDTSFWGYPTAVY